MTIKNKLQKNIRRQGGAFSIHQDIFLIINLVLIFAFGLALFYYVMVATKIAAQQYEMSELKTGISQATETNSALASQKVEKESLDFIAQFAESQNMIKAHNSPYLFENGGVALSQ